MPLFEYQCRQCGAIFEKLVYGAQKEAPVPCERCGSGRTKKRFSTFAAKNRGNGAPTSGGSCAGGKTGFT